MAHRFSRRASSGLIRPSVALSLWLAIAAGAAAQSVPPQAPAEAGSGAALCTPDLHTLCFDQGRFSARAGFQLTPLGPVAPAHAVTLTDQTGYFWFFDPANVELMVKVLDGCSISNAYWVFASGLTNVGVSLTVKDLQSGEQQVYTNLASVPFAPIQDTGAFHTCP